MAAIERIMNRGNSPCGGTLFITMRFEGVLTKDLPRDRKLTDELEKFASKHGNQALHDQLSAIDPKRASQLHVNDVRRVSRAIEIYKLTGQNATWWYSSEEKRKGYYDVLYLGLNRPRLLLFDAIEKRVHQQFDGGFIEEVEWLLHHGFDERFHPCRVSDIGNITLSSWEINQEEVRRRHKRN